MNDTNIPRWFCDTAGITRKRVLDEATRKQFLAKELVSIEFTGLSLKQEEELFARVQMGVPLSLAEKMRASRGPWQELARLFVDDFPVVYSLLKDPVRAKDFQLTLSCFSQIVEVQRPTASNGIPAFKITPAALSRFMADTGAADDGIKSHLANIWKTFQDLIAYDPDIFTNENSYLKGVQTFAPIEMVAVTVLISFCPEAWSKDFLLKDIKALRLALREHFTDLRINTQIWKFVWRYLKDLEDSRGLEEQNIVNGEHPRKPQVTSDITHPVLSHLSRVPAVILDKSTEGPVMRMKLPSMPLHQPVTLKRGTEERPLLLGVSSPKRQRTDLGAIKVTQSIPGCADVEGTHSLSRNGLCREMQLVHGQSSVTTANSMASKTTPQFAEKASGSPHVTGTAVPSGMPLGPQQFTPPAMPSKSIVLIPPNNAPSAPAHRGQLQLLHETPSSLIARAQIKMRHLSQTLQTAREKKMNQTSLSVPVRATLPDYAAEKPNSTPPFASTTSSQTPVSDCNNYQASTALMGTSAIKSIEPSHSATLMKDAPTVQIPSSPGSVQSQEQHFDTGNLTVSAGLGASTIAQTEGKFEGIVKSRSPTPTVSSASIGNAPSQARETHRTQQKHASSRIPVRAHHVIDLTSDSQSECEGQDLLSSLGRGRDTRKLSSSTALPASVSTKVMPTLPKAP